MKTYLNHLMTTKTEFLITIFISFGSTLLWYIYSSNYIVLMGVCAMVVILDVLVYMPRFIYRKQLKQRNR